MANSLQAMRSPAWTAALDAFDQDLSRRAVAAKTRRAYASDVSQLADWASVRGLDPATIGVRELPTGSGAPGAIAGLIWYAPACGFETIARNATICRRSV